MDLSEVKHLPKVDHTPAELDEASKLLLKAAVLIEEHGLWQGDPRKAVGGICAILAIPRDSPAAYDAQERLIKAVGGTRIVHVFEWNDAPERTAAEVCAKLRAVALGL
jgi:hypothetical protein